MGGWRWYRTRRRLRTHRVWKLPVVLLLVGLFLSWLLPAADREFTHLQRDVGEQFFPHLDSGSMSTLLGAVAGGMITLTGLVFTALTLAMQFGAAQLSVRVVPILQQEPVMRWAMGTFMATFVYTLMVSVRLAVREEDYRPVLSMLFAIGLSVVCAVLFFALVARVSGVLNSGALLRTLAAEGRRAVFRTHPSGPPVTGGPSPEDGAPADGEPEVVRLGTPPRSGQVLLAFDARRLERLARRWGVRVELVPVVGDFVALEAPLFAVYGPGGRARRRALLRCLLFGETQSVSGDPAGALRALVDIALKALSPAVNDPGRAVQVLDHIEDLLVLLAPRTASEPAARTTAFTHRTRSWADYVCIGTDEIRHFGAASVQVQRRLRALYATVVPLCGPERAGPVDARLATMDAEALRQWPQELDRHLAGRPDPQGLGTESGSEPPAP
ncbi:MULTISPECIES: DUF2254 family protein [Streptomyces]|uniref:DUF2254 family protein n=1 Tax=Streptomyces TaxID=1883 RepID=UPI0004CCACE6|nr:MULTISPECIES: DUF2254 family protein [Streptomyces]KOT60692.1 hypothetical protein ADK43_13435 [Streptomyces rimosus subsp. rimosus]